MSMMPLSIPPARDSSYPVREGCAVRPLVDGPEAFGAISRAVNGAKHSVWVTIAFIESAFRFPDENLSLLDLLDKAGRRGVDVRALFWREPKLEELVSDAEIFAGTPEQRAELAARNFSARIRWDVLPGFCHHQKSWLIDAGRPSEVAFVGGINLDHGSLSARGHAIRPRSEETSEQYAEIHDVYAQIRGPACTDVAHNFVQRWNEASERDLPGGCFPDRNAANDLPLPAQLSAPVGQTPAQISRTIMPGVYRDGTPPPGAAPFPIEEGESSVREQVRSAIASARESIYIENQIFLSRAVLGGILDALERGVRVIAVVPRVPMREIVAYRKSGLEPAKAIFDLLAKLADYERFSLVGLAQRDAGGEIVDVYVHAKIMLVDDAWATIGSTNFVGRSFKQETEMNVTFWDSETVRNLRESLFAEHLAGAADGLTARGAFERFATLARENQERLARGEPITGLAHTLVPATYAT